MAHLINSTVSGNQGPGIANSQGILTLDNTTIAFNNGYQTGGLSNYYGTVTIKNSIVAMNNLELDGHDCSGTITSSGYNLVGSTTGCSFTSAAGDKVGSQAGLALLVGPPGDPYYHPLLPGSAAINGGNPAGCTNYPLAFC